MRYRLALVAYLAASPALAESHDHDAHVAEAEGIRVIHVWTPATPRGSDALFYMEIESSSGTDTLVTGAEARGMPLDLVGFSYGEAGESWTVLPGMPIAAGSELHLEPKTLALRWKSVPVDLIEGADLEIDVALGGHTLRVEVEIGAPTATAHSHAGHNH